MGLLDELKKQIASTEDIAKLKTAGSLLNKRIAELEAPSAEGDAAVEAPSEEVVETAEEMPEAGAEESVEEAVEEPVPVKKPVKAPSKPKLAAGMAVYGTPTLVKFNSGDYRKGDTVAFEAKIEKVEGDKAIIVYTDKDRPKALGNPPKKVRVALKALEPILTNEETSEDIPEED